MNKPATTIEALLNEHVAVDMAEGDEDEEDDDDEDGESHYGSKYESRDDVGNKRLQLKFDPADESVLFHPRFAAGQVFTPELWGVMLGRMFYMPAVIELVEGLSMPHRRGQSAYPWQVRIPRSLVGRGYIEM